MRNKNEVGEVDHSLELTEAIDIGERDRIALLEELMKAKLIEAESTFVVEPREPTPIPQPKLITPKALEEFRDTAKKMAEEVEETMMGVREEMKEKIVGLRARLDLLEQRLDQFADFSGDSGHFLDYVGMKIEDVVMRCRKKEGDGGRLGRKGGMAVEKYLRAEYLIEEGSEKQLVAELRKRLDRIRFLVPISSVIAV
jgi:hypothetical protein